MDSLAVEAEETAHHVNIKAVYANAKRKLSGIFNKPTNQRDKNGGHRLSEKKVIERYGRNISRIF